MQPPIYTFTFTISFLSVLPLYYYVRDSLLGSLSKEATYCTSVNLNPVRDCVLTQ